MKVYTDQNSLNFFKTDNFVKNLRLIEINTIKDFVFKYSLDPLILLDCRSWMIVRFDELVSGKHEVEHSYDLEPDMLGESLDIDFVSDLSYFDILIEINKYVTIDEDFIKELKAVMLVKEIESNNGDVVAFELEDLKKNKMLVKHDLYADETTFRKL